MSSAGYTRWDGFIAMPRNDDALNIGILMINDC